MTPELWDNAIRTLLTTGILLMMLGWFIAATGTDGDD